MEEERLACQTLIFGVKIFSIKTKKIIYKDLVQSILICGAETWTLNTQHTNKLLANEMDFWRRSARKSWKESFEMTPLV
jgi:hypothetical protein